MNKVTTKQLNELEALRRRLYDGFISKDHLDADGVLAGLQAVYDTGTFFENKQFVFGQIDSLETSEAKILTFHKRFAEIIRRVGLETGSLSPAFVLRRLGCLANGIYPGSFTWSLLDSASEERRLRDLISTVEEDGMGFYPTRLEDSKQIESVSPSYEISLNSIN